MISYMFIYYIYIAYILYTRYKFIHPHILTYSIYTVNTCAHAFDLPDVFVFRSMDGRDLGPLAPNSFNLVLVDATEPQSMFLFRASQALLGGGKHPQGPG